MNYLTFQSPEPASFEICFLLPFLVESEIRRHYIEAHLPGLEDRILAYDLHKGEKQTKVSEQREYLDGLYPVLDDLGVKYLVVCDAEYFKTLTKSPKAEGNIGFVKPSVCGRYQVVYCPNHKAIFYNPEKVKDEIRQALTALQAHRAGTYMDPGLNAITFSAYPKTLPEIRTWLQRLIEMDVDLAADIEAFSLKHNTAGIGTISFAWSQHEGIAFPVDLDLLAGPQIRILLRDFFRRFGRRMLWHNISYDAYVLVYQLFMEDILDTAGLLDGLSVMLKNWECTKLITYLATNSCAGNKLGLKAQSAEFLGDYGLEDEAIKDIRLVPLDELLEYNLADTCGTWFTYNKHWPTLVADEQETVYRDLFQPAIWDIIQMQLTGLPVDMNEVLKLEQELYAHSDAARRAMETNPLTQAFLYEYKLGWIEKENLKLKTKKRTMAEADAKVHFNPNSDQQLQMLLFHKDHMDLPVLDTTDSGAPSTAGDTIEKLKNHTKDPDSLAFLDALLDFKSVDKIITAFIPPMLNAVRGPDGWHYLFGNFNLGGTKSGRLSSSKPNLQNLPSSGTKWAKLVKRCFRAPPGWLFVGLDFDSLEDRISALTTKDPNKLKVYTDGYDGHCLRAYSYFGEHMPDIDGTTVEGINAIKKKYPDFRQDSKAPTFALTYQGTFSTLMNNCGFSEELAKAIESRYHELYQVSDKWVADKLEEATKTGYVTLAFGLRLRTPLLSQVILGNRRTPYEAAAEGRTAGNALGQSWCLLNTRAGTEFMSKVRASEHRLNIRPCAHIHDAQYYLIRDDWETLTYTNMHLSQAVRWQDDPAIWHDEVKLSGQLDIYYPSWAEGMTIPNDCDRETFKSLAEDHREKYEETLRYFALIP